MKGIFDDLVNIVNTNEQKEAPAPAEPPTTPEQPQATSTKDITPENFYGSSFNDCYKVH